MDQPNACGSSEHPPKAESNLGCDDANVLQDTSGDVCTIGLHTEQSLELPLHPLNCESCGVSHQENEGVTLEQAASVEGGLEQNCELGGLAEPSCTGDSNGRSGGPPPTWLNSDGDNGKTNAVAEELLGDGVTADCCNIQCALLLSRATDDYEEAAAMLPLTSMETMMAGNPTEPGSEGQQRPHVLERSPPASCKFPSETNEVMEIVKENEQAEEPQACSSLLVDEDYTEDECPICIELYDADHHKQSLLSCNHACCDSCVKAIMKKANQADLIRCPICRQKTPMLQDQTMDTRGPQRQQEAEPVRGPGLCGALEYRFQQRFRTTRIFACCFRYPVCLIDGLARLRARCRCLYLCALAVFYLLEKLCLLLLLLPVVLLVFYVVNSKRR
ncbi:ring finger protein-like [Ascaphus truei]|uniref:ring finger protein-like n=1 Tax=Ascaphus truei TaxID=8439 RepID=UPI003F598695